eukprot:8799294-Pyramimonas_sp.AAC.1
MAAGPKARAASEGGNTSQPGCPLPRLATEGILGVRLTSSWSGTEGLGTGMGAIAKDITGCCVHPCRGTEEP